MKYDKYFYPKQTPKDYTSHEHQVYLASSKWKDLKNKVLLRDNNTCKICGSVLKLVVHHKTYKNWKHEQLKDLVTVCEHCHSKIHDYHLKKLCGQKLTKPRKQVTKEVTHDLRIIKGKIEKEMQKVIRIHMQKGEEDINKICNTVAKEYIKIFKLQARNLDFKKLCNDPTLAYRFHNWLLNYLY